VIRASPSLAYDPVIEYALGFDAIAQVAVPQRLPRFDTESPEVGKVAPYAVNTLLATGVTPADTTFGSSGIANVAIDPQVSPAHGSAAPTVRLNDVM